MKEKWNQFVYFLCEDKKNRTTESAYHKRIEAQLQLLGWSMCNNEICHKPNLSIGSSGRIQPDILIQKDNDNQFVIEVKRPTHTQRPDDCTQLLSYMRQLRLDVGIYIGEHIEIFYDQPDNKNPLSVLKIPLELNNKRGVRFIELFSKDQFSKDRIIQFCKKRIDEMQRQESLKKIKDALINNAGQLIKEVMKQHLLEKYADSFSETDITEMLETLDFTATSKQELQMVPLKNSPRTKNPKPKQANTIQAVQKKGNLIYCYLTRNADAKGLFDSKTKSLTVLKESKINQEYLDSTNPKYKKKREELIDKYVQQIGDELIVMRDIVFTSPSGAAQFCIGGSSNGWKDWKDNNDNKLEIYRK